MRDAPGRVAPKIEMDTPRHSTLQQATFAEPAPWPRRQTQTRKEATAAFSCGGMGTASSSKFHTAQGTSLPREI